jgi:hypothetical protein
MRGKQYIPPLPFSREAVVLDEQGLDVLGQQLVMLHAPVPQDASSELVVWVAGPAQHHLYHFLTGPVGKGVLGAVHTKLASGTAGSLPLISQTPASSLALPQSHCGFLFSHPSPPSF